MGFVKSNNQQSAPIAKNKGRTHKSILPFL